MENTLTVQSGSLQATEASKQVCINKAAELANTASRSVFLDLDKRESVRFVKLLVSGGCDVAKISQVKTQGLSEKQLVAMHEAFILLGWSP